MGFTNHNTSSRVEYRVPDTDDTRTNKQCQMVQIHVQLQVRFHVQSHVPLHHDCIGYRICMVHCIRFRVSISISGALETLESSSDSSISAFTPPSLSHHSTPRLSSHPLVTYHRLFRPSLSPALSRLPMTARNSHPSPPSSPSPSVRPQIKKIIKRRSRPMRIIHLALSSSFFSHPPRFLP